MNLKEIIELYLESLAWNCLLYGSIIELLNRLHPFFL